MAKQEYPKPTHAGLPDTAYALLDSDGSIIRIQRGITGYWPCNFGSGPHSQATVDALNADKGVSKAQAEAMKVGSMFGWNCPGADPASYDENGNAKDGFR